jgi:hypothetical protein
MEGVRRVMTVGRRFLPNRLSDQALSQAYQPLVPIVRKVLATSVPAETLSLRASIPQPQVTPRRAAGGHR